MVSVGDMSPPPLETAYACAWMGKGTEEATNKPQRRKGTKLQCEQNYINQISCSHKRRRMQMKEICPHREWAVEEAAISWCGLAESWDEVAVVYGNLSAPFIYGQQPCPTDCWSAFIA